VFYRCRRHTGFEQLDPPTIHDLVLVRRGDSHGPAEMMSDSHTHALKYLASGFAINTAWYGIVFVIGLYAQQVLPRWAAPALSAERAL
jgi:hypothetical protein